MWHDAEIATMVSDAQPHSVWHQPVLGEAVVRFLAPRPGAVIVDGTVGTAGHSLLVLPRLMPDGRLIAVDQDAEALAAARIRLAEFVPQVELHHGNVRELPAVLQRLGRPRVDGLLLDLGMSSMQVDAAERGFSFLREGPLDMRMDQRQPLTAAALLHERSAEELAELFTSLGEERFAWRIARRIVEARRRQPLATTVELARVVSEAVPPAARHGRLHPATRVFQALRMAVNDELGALTDVLDALPDVLAPQGRAVIISFQSLEDRLVKHRFLEAARAGWGTVLTKKPVRPDADEIRANPRARSAKLRAMARCA